MTGREFTLTPHIRTPYLTPFVGHSYPAAAPGIRALLCYCGSSTLVGGVYPSLLSGIDPCITSHMGYVRFPLVTNEAQIKSLAQVHAGPNGERWNTNPQYFLIQTRRSQRLCYRASR